VGRAIKEMKDKKATGNNEGQPGEELKFWGDDSLRQMAHLITTYIILESGSTILSYNDFLKGEGERHKMHRPSHYQLICNTTKIVERIRRRRIERKSENLLGEDQFVFRRGKEIMDAVRMLRIISEQAMEIDEVLCACFKDWQEAFDSAELSSFLKILNEFGIDWSVRRLINKLFVCRHVKV
jgi:hypothetical protein